MLSSTLSPITQAAHKMTRFPPQACLLRTVRLTRTAYAQLIGQKFYPPKIFGHWQEKEGTPQWRWRDLGMKIVSVLFQEYSRFDRTAM